MNNLFNPQIILPQCTYCNGDMYQRNDNDEIISVNGIDQRCSCYLPNQYLNANIGFEYWTIDETNFDGDEEDLKQISFYFDKIDQLKQEGRGFYISGPSFGSGKTSCSLILLMKAIQANYSALFLPCSELIITNVKYMQNHYDSLLNEKIEYIKNVDFLVIDDLGKEFDDNKDWSRATLNSILRYRAMWKKITIFTSNLEIDSLANIYGGSNHSIINGYSYIINIKNTEDYRKTNKIKTIAKNKKAGI